MKPSLISTIPETLVCLEKATGKEWTQSYFFHATLKSKQILYAVTPPGRFPTLRKLDYGEAVAKEYPEFTRRLAELHNVHIKELILHGDTFTQHCINGDTVDETIGDVTINVAEVLSKALNPYPDPFEYYFFGEPVHVTVDQVRVSALVIERLIRDASMDGDVKNQPTKGDALPGMGPPTVGGIDMLTSKHATEKTSDSENKIVGPCKLKIGTNERKEITEYVMHLAAEIIAADKEASGLKLGDACLDPDVSHFDDLNRLHIPTTVQSELPAAALPGMSPPAVGGIDMLTSKHATEKTSASENKILKPCKLNIGRNEQENILKYVRYRTSEMVAADNETTGQKIGDIVARELKEKGCKGQTRFLSGGTIARLIPSGMTGGRGRNGKKSIKK